MYKSTARGEQFLTRTGSESTKGSRKGFGLLGGGEDEVLTPEQQRNALVAVLASLRPRLTFLNDELKAKRSWKVYQSLKEQRDELVRQQMEIQGRLAEVNQLCKGRYARQDLGHFIIDVVRERMTKPEWEIVMREAKRRYDEQEKEIE